MNTINERAAVDGFCITKNHAKVIAPSITIEDILKKATDEARKSYKRHASHLPPKEAAALAQLTVDRYKQLSINDAISWDLQFAHFIADVEGMVFLNNDYKGPVMASAFLFSGKSLVRFQTAYCKDEYAYDEIVGKWQNHLRAKRDKKASKKAYKMRMNELAMRY